MIKNLPSLKSSLITLLITWMLFNVAAAASISSATSGNWNSTTTWAGGVVPGAGDIVTISNGHAVTVTANTSCTNLIISGTNANTGLSMSSGVTLNVSSVIMINAATSNNITNLLAVEDGIVNCSFFLTMGGTGVNRKAIANINNGTFNIRTMILMYGTGSINYIGWTGNGTLQIGGTITGGGLNTNSLGTTEYYGTGGQSIMNYTYNHLKISNTGTKYLGYNISAKDVLITDNAQLDAAMASRDLIVGGSFLVTSTNSDPFVERMGKVIFNGTSGTQYVSTVLAAGETFYELVINNTSVSVPGIQLGANVNISNKITYSSGTTDLKGNTLRFTGPAGNMTSSFSGGNIISSVNGGNIIMNDPGNYHSVVFNGTDFGDATNGVNITATGKSFKWINTTWYGNVSFTKTGSTQDDFPGGNTFYGPCLFKTTASAGRFRFSDSPAPSPDVFYNATFEHNGSGNYIVGANSLNNQFYGTTSFISTSSGGMYVCRTNGGGQSSSVFHGPVIVNINLSGNMNFADAGSGFANSVTFENTIQLNSGSSSSGDIYFGNNSNSTISLSNTAQFVNGNLQGLTSIYLYKVNQTGSLTQTIYGVGNTKIYAGSNNTPSVFNGPVSFTADTVKMNNVTFNGNTDVTANSLVFYNSGFNGATNNLIKAGSVNNSCSGNNIFGAGNTTIRNNGSGYLRLATSNSDDYNGQITFIKTGTGALEVAYNDNCTFAGDISTVGSTGTVGFGTSGGRIILDGNTDQTILAPVNLVTSFPKLTVSKLAGKVILDAPLNVSNSLTLTQGVVQTSVTNILTLTDESVNVSVGNNVSYIDGPMAYKMSSGASGGATLNFPLGKGGDWRPLVLTPKHSNSTGYTYIAELFNASADALGWTLPATVDHVSGVHYWDIIRTDNNGTETSANLNSAVVTLNYKTNFGSDDGVTDFTKLSIVKAPITGNIWTDIGGTANANGNGSVLSSSFNSFSRFTLANKIGGSNPLPIELTSIGAEYKDDLKSNLISWRTASEINNDYFSIEKSEDGINFSSIGKQAGNGTTSTAHDYSFVDTDPYAGINYYRLLQVDYNGQFTYSPIVSVEVSSASSGILLYPNPCESGRFNIALAGFEKDVILVVRDINGREVARKTIVNVNSSQVITSRELDIHLSSGLYLIIACSDQNIVNRKIIIK